MKEICEFCEQPVDDYLLQNHQKFFHADEFDKEEEGTDQKKICEICAGEFLGKFN
jgi:hypothetical protein